ncbi:MAG TPA: hypothetical protein VEK33_13545 [Terriglobales bacterium]|nr:hypothetical protein [Terriglobales bacterium]
MERSEPINAANGKADMDTLFFVGGVALMVFGAGLILSNPIVRRYMGQIGVGNLATAALPDLQRYLRLRDM